VSQDGREYYAPKTLILKKRGIEIKKEITELRITRMAKASGKNSGYGACSNRYGEFVAKKL
jgi:hypothetical protein